MTDSQNTPSAIPAAVTSMYRHIPERSWEQLSARRWRATHPTANTAVLVLMAFGTTIGVGCRADEAAEQRAWAGLVASAAELAAHRMSCEEQTPIVRPVEAGSHVSGCCWWCGGLPEQHVGIPQIAVRDPGATRDALVLAEQDGIWLLRPVGDPIGSTGETAPDDAPPPWGIRSAEAAGYVVTGWRRAWVLEGCTHPDLEGAAR